jgi:hypothetical protein
MKKILLLGAGFSKNWGGWTAEELVHDLMGRLVDDVFLSNLLKTAKSFEEIIPNSQRNVIDGDTPETLTKYMSAIYQSFEMMNRSFMRKQFEFSTDIEFSIRFFLSQFDAIFTTNQDQLLEIHYNSSELLNLKNPRFPYFPGMQPPPNWRIGSDSIDQINGLWKPLNNYQIDSSGQPIYKLHGSINWSDGKGSNLLVMGTNKIDSINNSDLFSNYLNDFKTSLESLNTKLMVIGYSFSDPHIDQIIFNAWKDYQLKTFIVDPQGMEVFVKEKSNKMRLRNNLESISIIGISRRYLSQTFKDDHLEHDKLMNFFNN